MKRAFTIFFFLFLIVFFSNTVNESNALVRLKSRSNEFINSKVESYQEPSTLQNMAFVLEGLAYTTYTNQIIVTNKIVKSNTTSIVFKEHQTSKYFNQYSLRVRNLLIRFRKKAIIFPFQYFW